MGITELQLARSAWFAVFGSILWLSVRIAFMVALVVGPFGYTVSGNNNDVLMGVGSGVAVGVGVGLKRRARSGLWTGVLVGAVVGCLVAYIAGAISGNGLAILLPPTLAFAVGVIDGLGTARITSYNNALRVTLGMAVLLGIGLIPVLDFAGPLGMLALVPLTAMYAGLLSRNTDGRLFVRPPIWMIGWSLMLMGLLIFLVMWDEGMQWEVALILTGIFLVLAPMIMFAVGKMSALWLDPRLRLYMQLANYMRVMWVPLGGFAVGYFAIIVLFAGFYGMLYRFHPDAFLGVEATGLGSWLFFSFFTAVAQDYNQVVPASIAAKALVGLQLILSIGWAVVVFATVMTHIQPQLAKIAEERE